MIKFPSLKNGKKKVKKYVHGFNGINNLNTYEEGDLESCNNIDIDKLPYLSPGKQTLSEKVSAEDLLCAEGIARIETASDGTRTLYFRPEKEDSDWNSYPVEITEGKKEIAYAGGKVILMPDKKYLDLTKNNRDWGSIEKEIEYAPNLIFVHSGYLVFTKSEDFNSFKNSFNVGDVVTFTGGYYRDNKIAESWIEKKLIVREISKSTEKKVTFDPYSFGDAYDNTNSVCTFKKVMPDISRLCSFGDRVWGVTEDGKIMASKYLDPTNFEYFDFSSADSFTLEAGAGGSFTASCATANYVAFFRENKIHRITGTKPSNYRHSVIRQNGVMSGSERSVAIIDDIVYYEGKHGFYAFDGGEAQLISEKLGKFDHSLGVASFYGDEYRISVKNKAGNYELYYYNTRKGIWVKDGIERYLAAANFMGTMYYVGKDKVIQRLTDESESQGFGATLRPFEVDFAEKKGYLRICVGYSIPQYGKVTCSVSYNGGPLREVARFTDHTKNVGEVRLVPNRGDTIKINVYGSHDTVIRYIMREYHTHGIFS